MQRLLNSVSPRFSGCVRHMRSRARESESSFNNFVVDNPKVVDPYQSRERLLSVNNAFVEGLKVTPESWPPLSAENKDENVRVSKPYCRKLLKEIEVGEIARLKTLRSFVMPRISLGDFVQVRYEMSRTQQTFAVFEGYCIKIAKKGLNASFSLKNTYDEVGVEQLFPFYSPRLLDVRILKHQPLIRRRRRTQKMTNRNYRYRWQYYVRHLYSEGFRVRWRQIRQHPGVMSLEPRIKREIANLRRQYAMMREEAGLPAYVWPGPYSVHMRQAKEVNAERMRRMLVYAWDAKRFEKRKRDLARPRWSSAGRRATPVVPLLDTLERKHPLAPGNLPK